MLTREQFEKLKHKPNPSIQDVAVLLVTVEQLFRRNDIQASELKEALKNLAIVRERLEWYRMMTIKDVSQGN